MSETIKGITVTESHVTKREEKERFYSDDEILDLFPDGDGSLVNPLLRRAQQAEAELAACRKDHEAMEILRKHPTWTFFPYGFAITTHILRDNEDIAEKILAAAKAEKGKP
jgi:hypothetical protein